MAKINIDKLICDYYEEKKHELPHGVWSHELDTIERLLKSQNLEIHDGKIKEIKEENKHIKVEQGTDFYFPSKVVDELLFQCERKGWYMLTKHAILLLGMTQEEIGTIIKIVKSWIKCDTNNESKSGAT